MSLSRKLRIAAWLIAALAAAAPSGCARDSLPKDPGLLADHLGVGVYLGQDVDEAREQPLVKGVEKLFLTREALNQLDPLLDDSRDKDLVIALYAEPEAGVRQGAVADRRIDEIRCYLAPLPYSAVKLLDSQAAALTVEGTVSRFGPPAEPAVESSGETHMTFLYQADPQALKDAGLNRGLHLRLLTSHLGSGTCYAFELSLTDAEAP